MSLYNFIRGIPGKLGVGVADLGFQRSHSIPLTPLNGGGVFVQRALGPTAPGFVKMGQEIVPVGWGGDTGNGGVYDPILLQRLAEQSRG